MVTVASRPATAARPGSPSFLDTDVGHGVLVFETGASSPSTEEELDADDLHEVEPDPGHTGVGQEQLASSFLQDIDQVLTIRPPTSHDRAAHPTPPSSALGSMADQATARPVTARPVTALHGELPCTSADLPPRTPFDSCLLYTSDAADEEDSVDLGGSRIIK
eukprot:TRINITY_DN32834_c0_g1_i1.p2 TRINITY_DN32834_c0_g1~~TRINITY_DN32834_c0_g1_i1.p2  ORF type:complete len:163 (-),score=42.57 TRINITY_DN32834_c0_g1_i1:51-539(-)